MSAVPGEQRWNFALPPDHPLRQQGLSLLLLHDSSSRRLNEDTPPEVLSIFSGGIEHLSILGRQDDQGRLDQGGTVFIFCPDSGALNDDLQPRNNQSSRYLQQLWQSNNELGLSISAAHGIPPLIIIFPGQVNYSSMLVSLAFYDLDRLR